MEILASPLSRTIMSTFSYIKAFCPKNYQKIIKQFTQVYLTTQATNLEDLLSILNDDYNDIYGLSNKTKSFKLNADYFFHGSETCLRSKEEL
jgi:hypothetical protein